MREADNPASEAELNPLIAKAAKERTTGRDNYRILA
jgi:hypothetical protein